MQSLHRMEKSHSPLVCSRQEISRLSVSIAPRSLSPYRHVPPLEMTVAAGSIRSFQREQMTETPPRPFVISTEAGQPPIGKPLIVQARGQLRLTWRLYAESPQSGEISLSHGMQQAACHHGAVIKKGCEEMMTISSQPFFKREYQMRIMLPAAKRRQ